MRADPGYPRPFGRFVLVAPLARGGMGELDLAVAADLGPDKLCVIKQMLARADAEYVQRFGEEARTMAQLTHGNLVSVLGSGVRRGRHFIAMEYVEGRNLRAVWNELQRAGRRMPLPLCLYIGKELCRGLHYAHTYGELELVHRDVTPPNVLLAYSGEVRLTDFGLAHSTFSMRRTAPGTLMGKLPYMSPEQARGEPLDRRADIYAVGIILWELITGRRLFARSSQREQLQAVSRPGVDPPSIYKPDLPVALEAAVMRALAPERVDRHSSAEHLRCDLARVLGGLAPTVDATDLQAFLHELFGDAIAAERVQRRELLRALEPDIRGMWQGSGEYAAADGAAESWDGPSPAALQVLVAGRYQLERRLGEGGMGCVYRARHTGIDRPVALKVLHREFCELEEVVSRFRVEARAASRIGNPHIVEVLDSGCTESGQQFLAMELLEGTDLAEVLNIERCLSVDRALHISVQICEALAAAHEQGILHRDLKPENVFLVPRRGNPDFVKLVDFGLARLPLARALTQPGLALGTPEYMAPEQGDSDDYDHRVDLYAMGILLYEMLAGRVPFSGSNFNEVHFRKTTERPVRLRATRGDVSVELDALVLRALAPDPAARVPSMAQLGYELRKIRHGRPGAVAALLDIAPDEDDEEPGFD